MKIKYLCNAGVFIEGKNTKVLIDALCKDDIPYVGTPKITAHNIINALPPFDNISAMLFTHEHKDHIDFELLESYIYKNPNTTIIFPYELTEFISKSALNYAQKNIIAIKLEKFKKAFIKSDIGEIKIICLEHEGKEYKNIKNFAYILSFDNKKIMHTGDSAPSICNYKDFCFEKDIIDVLIAPFSYISKQSSREIVKNYIDPKKILALHFPNIKYDKYNWIKCTHYNFEAIKNNFITTVFLENIGDEVVL